MAWMIGLTLVLVGLVQALAGLALLRRFGRSARHSPSDRPGVTVLKPLHGAEPWLEWALSSVAGQNYPEFQIICGVAHDDDAAIAAVEAARARHPQRRIDLVVDARQHGANAKISNLINMFPHALHDIVVISDSDVHVAPDWLDRLVWALSRPDVGLVTTLYSGLAVVPGMVARLGAMQICHAFLPGAVMARALGRQDSLGATMALRRETLARIGGLEVLADELADDAVLGMKIRALGMKVALAATIPAVGVPERSLRALWLHELRWARTVRSLAPWEHAASILQYPLVPAMALLATAPLTPSAWAVFSATWLLRAEIARRTDGVIARYPGLATVQAPWLWPVRDLLSVAVIVASFAGRGVVWRGRALRADPIVTDTLKTTRRRRAA